jgi:uncharacterized membrane protein (DUF4010 family)
MDYDVFKTFGEALVIGLLIGSERYRDRSDAELQTAGLRTFSVISLLGAACALLANSGFTLITFGALVVFMGLGYHREAAEKPGLTTEMAALLVFWLGYLLKDWETLALSTAIVLAILLAAKEVLHEFVERQVSESEFFATLKFLAVVLVVYPLLPDRYVGPLGFVNPSQIWLLVVLIATISYGSYLLIRILGRRRGLLLSALLGGLVSTTATTLSLAQRARETPAVTPICGVGAVVATAVQCPRLLFLIWFVEPSLGMFLLEPLIAMFAIGLVGAWLLSFFGRRELDTGRVDPVLKNPFSLGPVLKFAAIFVFLFFTVKAANSWFGTEGIYIASWLAGLGSVSAISLSVADLVKDGTVTISTASIAVFIALVSNAIMKWILSWVHGSRQLALWIGGGFAVILITGAMIVLPAIEW